MRFSKAQLVEKSARLDELLKAGWSTRAIADELGVSKSWVQKHKRSPSPGKEEGQTASEYVDISDDLSSSDDTTSDTFDSSRRILLTPKQKKYIEEQKQRAILYNDTAEGWLTALSEAAYKAAGSPLWFTAIAYPESAPDGWKDRLDATGIAWACVLHDKDRWNHDSPAGKGLKDGKPYTFKAGEVYRVGDLKKPHWHILGKLDKPMKYKKLCRLIQDITHGTLPIECQSLCGYFDYMLHLHNPDKYPYWKEGKQEIHNGFSPEMNSFEQKKAQGLIVEVIHKKKISTWGRLMKEYGQNIEFLDVIARKSGFFQRCVDHEYYNLHPEARLQYARQQTAETNANLKQIATNIDHLLTGEMNDENE